MADKTYSYNDPSVIEPTRMQPVGGGGGGGPQFDDIIVYGHAYQAPYMFQWVVWGWFEQQYYAGFARRPGYYFNEYEDVLVDPPAADEDKHEVTSTITRTLTAAEQAVYDKFLGEVAATDKLITSLPDTAIIRLPTGPDITGAQLKEIWAKTDFVINDVGFTYANGTSRGEAAFRDGNPQVSFNIDLIGAYVNDPSTDRGGLWAIFHELGHLTPHGQFLNSYYGTTHDESDRQYSERHANDFAKLFGDSFAGGSPSLAHLASEQPYSAFVGSIVYNDNAPPPQFDNFPWWKFDSDVGGGFVPIAS